MSAAPVIPVLRASLEGNRAENGTEGIEGKGVGVTKCTLHCEREGSGYVEGGGVVNWERVRLAVTSPAHQLCKASVNLTHTFSPKLILR